LVFFAQFGLVSQENAQKSLKQPIWVCLGRF
jgi:hypothetical protein